MGTGDDTMPDMTELAAHVHPSTVIEGDVELADDVVVGPGCVFDGTLGPVRVGAECRFAANAFVNGPITMGTGNCLWPGVVLGTAPQDVNCDPQEPGAGLVIGNDNALREGFSAHRGKTDLPTRIGDRNYFMANSHVGHDCVVGNDIQLANGALLGGHVQVGDRVILGGNAGAHQGVRLGAGVIIAGAEGTTLDVPAWCVVAATNRITTLNRIGMERSGMSAEEMTRRKDVFRIIYRSGLTIPGVVARLREEGDVVAVEYADFIESSQRGICPGPARGVSRRSGR